MKKKNLDSIHLLFLQQVLLGEVNEVTSNGLWLTTSCGKLIFISRPELELMRDLVANFF